RSNPLGKSASRSRLRFFGNESSYLAEKGVSILAAEDRFFFHLWWAVRDIAAIFELQVIARASDDQFPCARHVYEEQMLPLEILLEERGVRARVGTAAQMKSGCIVIKQVFVLED